MSELRDRTAAELLSGSTTHTGGAVMSTSSKTSTSSIDAEAMSSQHITVVRSNLLFGAYFVCLSVCSGGVVEVVAVVLHHEQYK